MDQLILEHLPVPQSTRQQIAKAIEMKYAWQYDHSTANVPQSIRNQVPSKLLKDGKLQLFKGEHGYLYEISPNGEWGMAAFVIKSQMIHG